MNQESIHYLWIIPWITFSIPIYHYYYHKLIISHIPYLNNLKFLLFLITCYLRKPVIFKYKCRVTDAKSLPGWGRLCKSWHVPNGECMFHVCKGSSCYLALVWCFHMEMWLIDPRSSIYQKIFRNPNLGNSIKLLIWKILSLFFNYV